MTKPLTTHNVARLAAVAAALVVGATACGGGDDGAGSADGVPEFISGYEASCTDGEAFAGASPFVAGPDAFPVAFFTSLEDGTYYIDSFTLTDGVAAPELSDPDDAAEQARVKAISAVACLDYGTPGAPTGLTCEYEDDDGDVTTLDYVDVTYQLTVRKAATGEILGTEPIEATAADTVCPAVLSVGEESILRTSADPAVIESTLTSIIGA